MLHIGMSILVYKVLRLIKKLQSDQLNKIDYHLRYNNSIHLPLIELPKLFAHGERYVIKVVCQSNSKPERIQYNESSLWMFALFFLLLLLYVDVLKVQKALREF